MGIGIVFIAAVYSIIVFAVKKPLSTSNLIGYGFTMLAFLIALIQFAFVGHGGGKEYPMFTPARSRITLVYLLVQFIFGGIIGVFFFDFPEILFLILEIVILVAYLIPALILHSSMSNVRQQDEEDQSHVSNIRMMTSRVAAIRRTVEDPELRTKMEKLEETIRYSDPVSNPALTGTDERIRNNLAILQEELEEGDLEKASSRIDRIINMVQERNDKTAALKR